MVVRTWTREQRHAASSPIAALAIALWLLGACPAWAQDAARPAAPFLLIAPTLLIEPGGETQIAIQVGPVEAIPRNSFVRVRGLPAGAFLSDGHAVAPGSWAVPIAGLGGLRVSAPPALQGRSNIEVALVTADGAVVAQSRSALVFVAASLLSPAPPQPSGLGAGSAPPPAPTLREAPATGARVLSQPAFAAPALAAPAPPPQPTAPPAPAQPPPASEGEDARKLRQRGEALLGDGNIAQARLFFQRAADLGSGPAAMALAQTHDPEELARLRAVGIVPDRAAARRWYERARDLGVVEAGPRLQRIGGR